MTKIESTLLRVGDKVHTQKFGVRDNAGVVTEIRLPWVFVRIFKKKLGVYMVSRKNYRSITRAFI